MDRNDASLASDAGTKSVRKFERLYAANSEIEASLPAGDDIGFLCSDFVRFTLPHRAIAEHAFEREDGKRLLTYMAPPTVGLPYGKWPRLVLIYLTTQAVRTRSREIDLGVSMSRFMKSLGAQVTGGPTGSIRQFKQQLIRTAALTWNLSEMTDRRALVNNALLVDELEVNWIVICTDQKSGLPSRVRLGERIFSQMLASAVPLDMRAVRAIQQSPLAMDLYAWLTFRARAAPSTHATRIGWASLKKQFGGGYNSESDFKIAVQSALAKVLMVYPELSCEATQSHFVIRRSKPSVPQKKRQSTPTRPCG